MYLTYESQHYIFHYQQESPAERDLHMICDCQEACFQKITAMLQVEFPMKIHYWLCNTPEEVGHIYGDEDPCNAFASIPDKIYAVYNENIHCIGPHEDAHLISYRINRPNSAFVREGLAMYFDKKWWGKSNEEWVKAFQKESRLPEITGLFSNDVFFQFDDSVTYPIAGAFTGYLIDTFGLPCYLRFYRNQNLPWLDAAESCFSKTAKEIISDFLISLR